MFYDPTPPLSSSWSEWSERMNRPGHYDDMEWGRPFREYTGSYTSPRIRRFDFTEESPRMSRTSSRSDVESVPETEETPEQEGKPPRVHRIPIMVECREDFQSTGSRPQTPESSKIQQEESRFTDFETPPQQSNTVPRRRRRNVIDDDIQRSQSQSSSEPMYNRFSNREVDRRTPQDRRRRNVTTVKVNYDPPEESREKDEIQCVIKEVDDLKKQVENLTVVQDKLYRYLDEMLTRCMLKLDNIDTMGSEEVRLARKNAIGRVQSCIDLLELKAHPPPPNSPKECENSPKHDNNSDNSDNNNNNSTEANKSVIVLPYYPAEVTRDDVTEAEKKNVIVLPYEKPENVVETPEVVEKTPEKTVIVLPYYENEDENKNVIPLPYHGCNDSCSESYCTKL